MRSKVSKFVRAAAITVLAMAFTISMAGSAWAEQDGEIFVNAGNVFGATEGATSLAPIRSVERDFCWAGADQEFSSIQAGGDILMAGKNITVSDSAANGSVRIAGLDLVIGNTTIGNNITAAGKSVTINGCETQGGIYCAAHDISFSGSCSGAGLAGENVFINGTVIGDMVVYGENVEVGPSAIITGDLHVYSSNEPVVSGYAQVESLTYEHVDNSSNTDAAAAVGALAVTMLVLSKVMGLIGIIIFAILLMWLFRRPVEGATAMTRKHAGRIFATGAITAVVSPLVLVLLFCLVVTSPIALAFLFTMLALTFIAVPFAAAAFARLVFPKMNRFGAVAIGGAVLGVVSIIPVLGTLLSIAAFMYLAGYAVQAVWASRRIEEPEQQPLPAPDPETIAQ